MDKKQEGKTMSCILISVSDVLTRQNASLTCRHDTHRCIPSSVW